jgi:hypothetical protein
MEVDLRAGFVQFYCQVNLEKYNRLALLTQFARKCIPDVITECSKFFQ